ncbi:hypothetical protein IWQ60_009255 [Tieghemiomyces parasiticus]|uniref:Uncharacterized protein n=1 Tax=Tieghemiomyces parasiticus TaxID=78921 RepID=A0A9W7ZUN2_9FUNG|nr:hypothetical protein IWQ60_009255 [Tieghemiomyces parasiticus]
MIIYTSGTTGRPKGVVTTHRNIAAQIGALVNAWGWSPNDRIYHALPLHHIHGIINALNCGLASGATVEMAPKFRADQAWQRWTDPDSPPISLFMAVPAMYSKLLQAYDGMGGPAQDQARAACGQFRLMVSGSSALPQPLFRRWREVSGHTLLERYGMTEIGMALSNPADAPGQRVEGNVGFPLSGVKVRLVDSGGRDITDQPDVSGELLVAGDAVFQEYWNRPDATRAAFLLSDDGTRWFKTGDTASVGHDSKSGSPATNASLPPGYWRILGRNSQDILKSGGYKLSALEIERQLLAHPQVADVAVVGVPDETLGQTVAAIVQVVPPETDSVLMAGTILSPGALVEFCRPRMARYKIPRTWKLSTEDIPRNAMGKVNKKDLVRLYFPDEVSAAATKS